MSSSPDAPISSSETPPPPAPMLSEETIAPPDVPENASSSEAPSATGDAERGRKRGRGAASPPIDSLTAAALAQATPLVLHQGLHGLGTILSNKQGIIPSVDQVQVAALKAVQDQPPWIHWNKTDMAQNWRVLDSHRLHLVGQLRGYRMARASVGCSKGSYYFECIVLPPPSPKEILASLPPNARLGPGLQRQLQEALEYVDAVANKKRKLSDEDVPQVGGHLRVGWSMRTGDLQAGVGYDKWSYGVRSLNGSIVHQSKRQDGWGGEDFTAGDVMGCAIIFEEGNNHIRFFKNGVCLGQFVISKGKRSGGEAFTNLEPGTYYPAVSSYMGGGVKANFGPHFIYPPRKLPAGIKLSPMTDLCPPPLSPEEALAKLQPAIKLFRKAEQQQALREAIQAEMVVLNDSYNQFMKEHLDDVRQAREERGLSVQDLPS